MADEQDPYAAFGGSVAKAPAAAPAADPYAAFGGTVATPPAAPPTQGTASKIMDTIHSAVSPVTDPVMSYAHGFEKQGKATVGGIMKILGTAIAPDAPDDSAAGKHLPDGYKNTVGAISDYVGGHLKKGAEWLNKDNEEHGFWEHVGGFGENIAELMTPEALAKLAVVPEALKGGETVAKVRGAAEKFAEAGQVAKVLKKYPRIASLVGVGLSAAARGATEAGLQTYAKTGGDTQAATTAAEMGGVAGGILAPVAEAAGGVVRENMPVMRNVEGVEVPMTAPSTPKVTPKQAAAADAYSATARAAARPTLEATGLSPEAVDAKLNSVHDLTGVSKEMKKANDAHYNLLDSATKGRFRKLNNEVQKAADRAWDGGPNAEQYYKSKVEEMDALLDTYTGGELTPDFVKAVKKSWNQSYVLGDIGKVLDRSLDGLPGRSNATRELRGLNGNDLENGLRSVVERFGYDRVNGALGKARLENLQALAAATKTSSSRAVFNEALQHVASYIGAGLGAAAGSAVSGGNKFVELAGAAAGAATGRATKAAVGRVLEAVQSNPAIGRQLLYAIENGGNPKVYGPLIGSMITQSQQKTGDDEQ